MTWAARHAYTIDPALDIYDGDTVVRQVSIEAAERALARQCACPNSDPRDVAGAMLHDPDLRADMAERVELEECSRGPCVMHAVGQGLCVLDGGSDPL